MWQENLPTRKVTLIKKKNQKPGEKGKKEHGASAGRFEKLVFGNRTSEKGDTVIGGKSEGG